LCSHSCKLKSVRLNQGKAVIYKRMCKQNTKKIIRQTKEGTGMRLADTLLEFQALNLSHFVEDCLPDIFSLVIRIQRTKATGNKCPKSGECTTDLAGQQLNGFSSDTDSLCNTDDAAYSNLYHLTYTVPISIVDCNCAGRLTGKFNYLLTASGYCHLHVHSISLNR